MRWKGREQSDNVIDNRGRKATTAVAGGGGLLAIIIAVVITLMSGGDGGDALRVAAEKMQQQAASQAMQGGAEGAVVEDAAERELVEFVGVVLRDTETVWERLLPQAVGKSYEKPKLELFRGSVNSACGQASAAVGPFYCPGDNQVYLDLSFFEELQTRFKAPGDFACAYVIAHEVGHHIQNLLGLSMEVQRRQARLSKAEGNKWSVRLELQADYLAGVWAHHIQREQRVLEVGDIEEALIAARQIGDDTLQREATGMVRPDSFTHGTSEQRIAWFKRGLLSGDAAQMSILFELDYDEL